jgi:hypothetical protein
MAPFLVYIVANAANTRLFRTLQWRGDFLNVTVGNVLDHAIFVQEPDCPESLALLLQSLL